MISFIDIYTHYKYTTMECTEEKTYNVKAKDVHKLKEPWYICIKGI